MGIGRFSVRRVAVTFGVAATAVLVLGLTACTPPAWGPAPSTTSTASTTTTIPRITIPAFSVTAPSFSASLSSVRVTYLGCGGTYSPPGFTIAGPSVSFPATTLVVTGSTLALPNVTATLAAASVNLSSFRVSCFGLSYSTGVVFEYNATTASPTATVNVANGTIDVGSTGITLTGKLRFPGFGGLSVNVPSVNLTVPGFSTAIPAV